MQARSGRLVRAWGAALGLLLAAAGMFASPAPMAAPITEPTPQSPEAASVEAAVLKAINAERSRQGLRALVWNNRVAGVARAYARVNAERGFLSHTGPAGDSVGDRMRRARIRFQRISENLYRATYPLDRIPVTSTAWWMNSPPHRAALLSGAVRESGVGVWQAGEYTYVTQLFYRAPRRKRR